MCQILIIGIATRSKDVKSLHRHHQEWWPSLSAASSLWALVHFMDHPPRILSALASPVPWSSATVFSSLFTLP